MKAAVGADIEAICRKCGDVWHVIVAMVDGSIAKVQCKECNGLHKYKPSGDAPAAAKAKTTTKRKSTSSSSSRKKKTDKPANVCTVEPDLSKPTRPYKFSESFEVAERIDHPKFGTGVVETVLDDGKLEVFFPEGRKILATAKAKATLKPLRESKPAWLEDLGTPSKSEL